MLPPSGGIFDYDRKIVEIQDEERITHQADFWNKPKEAEVILKNIRTKKVWTDAFDQANKSLEDLEVLNEFHEVAHIELIGHEGKNYELPKIEKRQFSNKVYTELESIKRGKSPDPFGWIYRI